MVEKFQYLSVGIYHPDIGREKEMLKLWQEGPSKFMEEMGGRQISIYYRKETNDYLETAHWPNMDTYLKFFNARTLRPWIEKINNLSREASIHESYKVIQERAA